MPIANIDYSTERHVVFFEAWARQGNLFTDDKARLAFWDTIINNAFWPDKVDLKDKDGKTDPMVEFARKTAFNLCNKDVTNMCKDRIFRDRASEYGKRGGRPRKNAGGTTYDESSACDDSDSDTVEQDEKPAVPQQMTGRGVVYTDGSVHSMWESKFKDLKTFMEFLKKNNCTNKSELRDEEFCRYAFDRLCSQSWRDCYTNKPISNLTRVVNFMIPIWRKEKAKAEAEAAIAAAEEAKRARVKAQQPLSQEDIDEIVRKRMEAYDD